MGRSRVMTTGAVLAAAAAGGLGGVLGVSLASAGPSAPSVLTGGQTITSGGLLQSPSGHYQLSMESNGNLVESLTENQRTLWQSGTSGNNGAEAVLEPGGDLEVLSSGGSTLWSSGASTSGCPTLNLLEDGSLQEYGPSSSIWSSGVHQTYLLSGDQLDAGEVIDSPNYDFALEMLSSGNLVVENTAGAVVWQTNTGGNRGAYVNLTAGGIFTVDAANGSQLYSASSSGNAGDGLYMQSDGNLVLYSGVTGKTTALWASNTGGAATGGGSLAPTPQYGSSTACPAQPPTTVTVTVPTTTVVTVSSSPTRTRSRAVKVPIAFDWAWQSRYTYLRAIRFGRVPSQIHWSATVTPARHGAKPRVYRSSTRRQRYRLLVALERQRYIAGEKVSLRLSRAGYSAEIATFKVQYHHVPALLGHAKRRR